MIKVSVIIPVYNGEKFISKTLNSILKQDLKCFEIIVIDDGSMDSTAKKVKEIFANNTRSDVYKHYYYQSNSGVSVARNNGLEKAKGKYVMFFDSDDLMYQHCLRKLFEKAESTSSEVVFCGFDLLNEKGKLIGKYSRSYSSVEGIIIGKNATTLMLKKKIRIWNGSVMFKSEFIEDKALKFQVGALYGEDQEFDLKALYLASRVTSVNKSLVGYVQRKGSTVRSGGLNQFHHVGSMKRLFNFFIKEKSSGEIINLMKTNKIPEAYLQTINSILLRGMSCQKIKSFVKNRVIKENLKNYTPKLFRDKVYSSFLLNMPCLYKLYVIIRNKVKNFMGGE
jgi:glycosyltransferase involved in cell wall biosynthesis